MTTAADPDAPVRLAAFSRLRELQVATGGPLPWSAIRSGFAVGGRKVLFASAAEGIFKPREMSGVLSLKTVVPKPSGKVWYRDQVEGDARVQPNWRPLQSSFDVLPYSFTGTRPNSARNQWLLDAMSRSLPLIYFYGVAPGIYEPLFPVYVVAWDPGALSISLAVSATAETGVEAAWSAPDPAERRYAMRLAKQRLHQAMFREQVVDAYGGKCALSGLPEVRLLDAAHIIRDQDEALGQPDVRNGILMSRIHHRAYDTGLIGIDPDYRIHISSILLDMNDGPLLEGLKELNGQIIRVPADQQFRPDRDRLAVRFASFEATR